MVNFKSLTIALLVGLTATVLKVYTNATDLEENFCNQTCTIVNPHTIMCSGLIVEKNGTLNFDCIPVEARYNATHMQIKNSTIPSLNLSFIEINGLNQLLSLTIQDSNITTVEGDIPCILSYLGLPRNRIKNFHPVLVYTMPGHKSEIFNRTGLGLENDDDELVLANMDNNNDCKNNSFLLDVQNNTIEDLPIEFVSSSRLQLLQLSGNRLKCEFFWETMWESLDCRNRRQECRNLIGDEHGTRCQFYRQQFLPSELFHYTLKQIFDSKITFEEECLEMNKTCLCYPFNLLRSDDGKLTVNLVVNCAEKSLVELPNISNFTWLLNVSSNSVKDLAKLNSSMYNSLRILDLSNNLLDERQLVDLSYTQFMTRFDHLYLNGNKYQKIPDIFFAKAKDSSGNGAIKIGSELECECETVTDTKGRMIKIQSKILDLNDVVCRNRNAPPLSEESDSVSNRFVKLWNLKVTDVCPIEDYTSEESSNWIIFVIVLEVLAIGIVVTKVIYDRREYQRTGVLPWIAQNMPRFPCDRSLE